LNQPSRLQDLETEKGRTTEEWVRVFAIAVMGVVGTLERGLWTAEDAARDFFNAENRLFVENRFKNRIASDIMCRGALLPDLFDTPDHEAAQRQFSAEVRKIRELSESLLRPARPAD
jgi:hypothetical protein